MSYNAATKGTVGARIGKSTNCSINIQHTNTTHIILTDTLNKKLFPVSCNSSTPMLLFSISYRKFLMYKICVICICFVRFMSQTKANITDGGGIL